ncbi:unnamed protein product [Prorocentrum cordatum]|uniref:Uncharacterized protein n=1 Tax=Prorocentrum cordatum TaxID=2364126 RepID=A0ABN9VVQ8_9DINO|nr:unnamed protein product [Polarella glacialis]
MAQTKGGKSTRGGKGRGRGGKGYSSQGGWTQYPGLAGPLGPMPPPWFGMPAPPWMGMYPGMPVQPGETPDVDPAAAADSLLDALAVGEPAEGGRGAKSGGGHRARAPAAIMAEERSPDKSASGTLPHTALTGNWVDSQGNQVQVMQVDAYTVKLMAVLSRPPRNDIHLPLKPITAGGGWQCGHSVLDPMWTSSAQLHWVAMDGRVSVWVRPPSDSGSTAESEGPAEERVSQSAKEQANADAGAKTDAASQ